MSDRDSGPSDTAPARSGGLHLRQPSAADDPAYDGVGADLRATRLQCNRTLEEVAERLRIRLVHLEAIEEGRFSDLPGSAYAVGFIRSYAEHLGLDGEAHVKQFKRETSTKVEATELKFPSPIPEARLPGVRILVFSVLLIAVVYGVWYYVSQSEQMPIELVGEVPEHLAATDEPVPDATTASAANKAGGLTLDGAAAMAPRSAPPAPADETAAADITLATAGAPVSPSDEGEEEVSASSDPVMVPSEGESTAPDSDASTAMEEDREIADDLALVSETGPAVSEESVGDSAAEDALSTASSTDQEPAEDAALPAIGAPTATDAEASADEPEPARDDAAGADEETGSALATFVASLPSNGDIVDVSSPADAMGSLESGADRSDPEPADDELAVVAPVDASPAAVTGPDEPQQASLSAASGAADLESPPAVPTLSDAVPETGDDAYIPQVFGAGNDDSRVVVMARMDSWVQITGAGNELFLTRILRAGDKYFAPNRPDLVLMTGNAGAIQIFVDGQAVQPLGPVGKVRRDVSLDPETLLAATPRNEESGSTRGR